MNQPYETVRHLSTVKSSEPLRVLVERFITRVVREEEKVLKNSEESISERVKVRTLNGVTRYNTPFNVP